jgi:hypothetical protein
MGMHRDQARKAAGRAKIAAAGLVVLGGAVLFIPLPKLGAAPGGGSTSPLTGPAPQPARPAAPAFDAKTAEGILAALGPEPRPDAPVEPDTPPIDIATNPDGANTEPHPAEAHPVPASELRYLGPVIGPRRTLAMVSFNGQQKMVAIGEQVDGKTVTEVAPTHLRLNDDQGVEHTVTMAERVLEWSQEPSTPRGLTSKRFTGPAQKAGANAERDPHESELERAMDVELKRQMEARRLEEAQRATDDSGGANSPATAQARPRPSVPSTATPRTPSAVRGTTPPRTPPARPNAPLKKPDDKKAGNQA